MYPDNNWYSHRKILAEYCGIEDLKKLLGSIQHGWINPKGMMLLIKESLIFIVGTIVLSNYSIKKGFKR